MYILSVKGTFCAAHFLKDYDGECENIHGHNYKVTAKFKIKGLQNNGITIDFKLLDNALKTILKKLDHKNLNDLDYFKNRNASAEIIAEHIANKLLDENLPVSSVKLSETDKYSVEYVI